MKRVLCLMLSGCFAEPPTVEGTSESSGNETSTSMDSSSSTTTEQHTSDGSGTSLQTGDETTDWESTDSESTGTGTGTTEGSCEPVEIPVDGPWAESDTMTLQLDFDTLPGSPGETAELCLTFSTTNPASARTITIEDQLLAFGPCGARPAPMYLLCAEYLKPAGVVDVLVDNTTFGPGCQNGSMDDVVLVFGCTVRT